MSKCKCGKEVFTEIHINRRGLSSSVCIDCLEKLIKENTTFKDLAIPDLLNHV